MISKVTIKGIKCNYVSKVYEYVSSKQKKGEKGEKKQILQKVIHKKVIKEKRNIKNAAKS